MDTSNKNNYQIDERKKHMLTIGQRIKYIRRMRGLTQKQLGELAGFPSSNADTRIAQYEKGRRRPCKDALRTLALVLKVSPFALDQDFSDNPFHILHFLMALEDIGKLRITRKGKKSYAVLDIENPILLEELNRWMYANAKYMKGEITKEEYDNYRYSRDREAYESEYDDSTQELVSLLITPKDTDVFVFEHQTQKHTQL